MTPGREPSDPPSAPRPPVGNVDPSGTAVAASPLSYRLRLRVLFTDLCGSTELGRQLEMEQFADLLERVRAVWRAAAQAHHGLVLRTQGDGAMIVFGHPQPGELDGLHAAQAALQIHRELAALSLQDLPLASPPQARSAFHAGMVLVTPGDQASGYLNLVGDAVNTAGKLEKAALPGQILATPAALGPNAGLLTWHALPLAEGVAQDLSEVVCITGRSLLQRRFDATAQRGLTPLVGRDAALQRLQGFLRAPYNVHSPRMALITAPAGLGKTRLLEELAPPGRTDPGLCLRGSCERALDSEVLQPFAQMLRALQQPTLSQAAGLRDSEALQAAVAITLKSASVDAYRDLFRQLAERTPTLLVLDDWQWADDASRRLLQALQALAAPPALAALPALAAFPALAALPHGLRFLVATRPLDDAAPDLGQHLVNNLGQQPVHHVVQEHLRPLDETETAQVVARWLPDADPFLVRRIHTYSGGVPLFVEELCHSASTDGLFQALEEKSAARQSWVATLVASRLARLPPLPAQLLRCAAVIGPEVPLALWRAASGLEPDREALDSLAEADFLYAQGATHHDAPVLRFKHGITRDAVYETIGLQERRQLHKQVLLALQNDATGGAAASPEMLAHHSWGAGMWAPAAEHAEQAGDKSAVAFAMDRSRHHYRAALEALAALEKSAPASTTSSTTGPTTAARTVARTAATTAATTASAGALATSFTTGALAGDSPMQPHRGLQACRVTAKLGMACVFDPLSLGNDTRHFERAVRLAHIAGDASAQARAQYWLGYIQYALGRFREAKVQVRAALQLSQRLGDAPLASQIEATLGQILAGSCEYDEALQCMERAVAAKRQRSRPGSGVAVGSAYTLSCMGSVWADRGDFAAAHQAFDQAIQLLGDSTHPVGNSVRNWIAVARIWQGDWAGAEQVALESVHIAENTQALLLLAVSRSTLGYARWRATGDPAALQLLQDAVGWMAARRGRMFTSLHFAWLAEACVAVGRVDPARQLTAHVLKRARQGERLGEAIACRAMARQALQCGDRVDGQRWLVRAQQSAAARQSIREAALNEGLQAELSESAGRH